MRSLKKRSSIATRLKQQNMVNVRITQPTGGGYGRSRIRQRKHYFNMNEPTIALNTYTMSPDKKLIADAARRIRYPARTQDRKKGENRRLGLELYGMINGMSGQIKEARTILLISKLQPPYTTWLHQQPIRAKRAIVHLWQFHSWHFSLRQNIELLWLIKQGIVSICLNLLLKMANSARYLRFQQRVQLLWMRL